MVIYWCYICKNSGKSVNFLLLHCLVVIDIWSFVSALFGISLVVLKTVIQILDRWQ